ncbi:hypothetical protein HZY97_19330 [Sphingomonas sp. R-74633]|uniref:hypothetical protein n=1 Tax=Sphingomonas sp. R-74633 TaxID=2751188 RepID=UPI0015D3B552|nr:hypothetical protein [Sphingomonas sp. R-74633]NYT42935.1 hypothetical protein [Sphingomonas sp. R-74633]
MASAAGSIADYLFDAAAGHVHAMGRHFGDGADARLHEMTAQAGHILTAEGASDAEIDKARDALIALLDHAAMLARDLPDYPDDLLGERSFFPALSWFCPRHPFC